MEKLSTLVISVAVVSISCLLCVVGESDVGNYGGKFFAFSFLADNKLARSKDTPCMIDLIAADNKNSTIHVTIPGRNFHLSLVLPPGQVQRVNLSLGNDLFGEDATVIINSTGRVGVVALMELLRPSAAFHVLPADYTGTHHVIANNYNTRNTQFTITSLADNNTVRVYSARDIEFECDHGVTDNSSYVLLKHDTMFCRGNEVDLTGTFVTSKYNISVVAGGRVQFFGDRERKGYVMEQMLPQRAWGKHFAVAPFANINESNYLLKFLVPEGVVANVIVKGLNWTSDFIVEGHPNVWFNDSRAFDQVVEIIANESVSVMQYMTGTSERAAIFRSDPSMFNVPPVSQAKHNLLVDVFPCENENIINIIIKCTHVEGLLVNGTDLKVGDGRVISILNGTTYCALSYELQAGLHCVSHKNPQASFQIILYSWKIKSQGQNAYAMEAALDVLSDYPTCLPVIDKTPASQLRSSIVDLQEEDYCGNDTSFNRPATIAMEIEQLAMDMTARMLGEGTPDIFQDLGVAVIEIRRINSSASNPATFVSVPSNDNSTQPKTRGVIGMDILRKLEIQALISIVFRNLGERIDNCSTSNDSGALDPSGTREMVGSEVLSLSLYPSVPSEQKLSSSVRMVFPMQDSMPTRFANGSALCSFWNHTLRGWSQEGCEKEFFNSSLVGCACDHLTNFAVLMQINEYPLSQANELAVNLITSVGCGLSIAGAFFTIFTFIVLRLKSDRVMIHINLAIAVGMGQIMFLFLDTPTINQVQCTVKASFLYYFYMSAFCWMLIEGVNLFLQAVVVFSKPGSRIKIYIVIGWLCPIIPLGATLGFYKGVLGDDVTDTSKAHPVCFVRREDDSIWFFVVPILTIILLNVYFVSRVIFEIIKLAGGPHVVKNRTTRAKHGVKACVILLPVMGLTWIFGVMWYDQSTMVFMYLFVIFNSLQGFFIFIFHCLLNSEVRHTFQRKKMEWRNSFSRRSSFNLNVFRSDDSKKKHITVDSNKLSAIATPNGSHANQNKD